MESQESKVELGKLWLARSNSVTCLILRSFYWSTTIPTHLCIVHGWFYAITAAEWFQLRQYNAQSLKYLLPGWLKFADRWSGKRAFPTLTKEKFCDFSSNSGRKEVVGTSSTILSNGLP